MKAQIWQYEEAFRVTAEGACTKCGRVVRGWIAFNKMNHIANSGGFMVFRDGLVCDSCLGEVYP